MSAAKKPSASLLSAIDKLNHARNLAEVAMMALAQLGDDRQAKALDAVLLDAITEMQVGIDEVETVRMRATVAP